MTAEGRMGGSGMAAQVRSVPHSVLDPARYLLLLIILAAFCTPALAAPADTPLPPGEVQIRQAHLSWMALITETEMDAAITYIFPLYGTDTARLTTLSDLFRSQVSEIPLATTQGDFDLLVGEMRAITAEFRNETSVQVTRGQGDPATLTLQVRAATTNNPYITDKEAQYWTIRRTNQLGAFDDWVRGTQGSLDTLKKQGYNTTAAQRTLDVTAAKRPDLADALGSRNEGRILAENQEILPLTRQESVQVREAQGQVSDVARMQFLVEQGYRGVAQADRINRDLTVLLLDIGPAEPGLNKVKTDLATTSRILGTGNLALAKTPFSLVRTDLRDLASAYRDIANTADLPPDLGAALRAMILTLESSSDQMEVS
jgi:hypothetical protein